MISEITAICCMCEKETNQVFLRKDGDEFCKECHEKYCQHLNTKTNMVEGSYNYEGYTVCLDCGCEI